MNFKHQISEAELDALLQPKLRLFMSVDISGSTALKHQSSVQDSGGWLSFFTAFYTGFPQLLIQANQEFLMKERTSLLIPHLWKALGDELVFVVDLARPEEADQYLTIFRHALAKSVTHHRHGHNPLPIHFKTYAWIAGFPLANVAIPTTQDEAGSSFDFVGPSMDIGFRLGSLASPRRFAVSVELAYLILSLAGHRSQFFFEGKRTLSGVLNDRGYPFIWIDNYQDIPEEHHHQEHRLTKAEDDLVQRKPADRDRLRAFCQEYISEMGKPLSLPFIKADSAHFPIPETFATDCKAVERRLRSVFTVVKETYPEDIELTNEPIPELEEWEPGDSTNAI